MIKKDNIVKAVENQLRLTEKPKVQAMTFDEARQIVFSIGSKILARRGKEWGVNEKNIYVIRNLIKYFINDPSCAYDLNKGIHLFGDVGVGKSFLMELMQMFCKVSRIDNRFDIISTCDVVERIRYFERFGNENTPLPTAEYENSKTYCFDDLGNEQVSVRVLAIMLL